MMQMLPTKDQDLSKAPLQLHQDLHSRLSLHQSGGGQYLLKSIEDLMKAKAMERCMARASREAPYKSIKNRNLQQLWLMME